MKINLPFITRSHTNLVLFILFLTSTFFSQKAYSQARTFTNPGLEFGVPANSNRQYDTNFGSRATFDSGIAATQPWYTTHPNQPGVCENGLVGNCHPMEVWGTGLVGFSAREGTNFVELNAYVNSMIYQNIYLRTGDVINYYFRHRARNHSREQSAMVVENENEVNVATIASSLLPSFTTGWTLNQGTYTFTGAPGVYRIGFRAIVAGNNPASGNLLDDVRVTLLPIIDLKLSAPNTAKEGESNGSLFLRINGAIQANTTVAVELKDPENGVAVAVPEDISFTPVRNSNGTPTIARTPGTNIFLITIPPGNYDGAVTPGYTALTNNEDGIQININALRDNIGEPLETYKFEIKEQNTNGSSNNFDSTITPVFGDTYTPSTGDYFIDPVCYITPNTTGLSTDSSTGISTLKRDRNNNQATVWPRNIRSANMVLESNTKGLVITRLTTEQVNALQAPQEGMMVYDTTEKCLKFYNGTTWDCYNYKACP